MGKCRVSSGQLKKAVQEIAARGEHRHRDKVVQINKPKTIGDKVRDWAYLQDAVEVKGVEAYKEDDFLDAMEALVEEGYHTSRFEKYRAAVVDQQLMHLPAQERWTRDRAFMKRFGAIKKRAMTCYLRKKTEDAKQRGSKALEEDGDADDGLRGAIVEEKGIQLVLALKDDKMFDYADGVTIAHAGLMRHGEIMKAQYKDFYKENGKWHVKIEGAKWREEGEIDYVPMEDAATTLDRIMGRGRTGVLFPAWDPEIIREAIRKCARRCGWDPNRRWDFHCLRHGKAVDNRVKGMPLEERMRRGRWKSEKTEKQYSRYR